MGRLVLDLQADQGWGTGVVERLAADLRAEFPGMRGRSRRNGFCMRSMTEAWPQIVQQPVAQLPWGLVTVQLTSSTTQAQRDYYAAYAAAHGWSRALLTLQIMNRLHERAGAALSNFTTRYRDSDLAREMVRDP